MRVITCYDCDYIAINKLSEQNDTTPAEVIEELLYCYRETITKENTNERRG